MLHTTILDHLTEHLVWGGREDLLRLLLNIVLLNFAQVEACHLGLLGGFAHARA